MARTKDMTVGDPTRLILLFSLPIIAGNLLQQFYSLADSLIVGRQEGVAALSAISASGWLDWGTVSLAIGLAQGFAIQIAQSFGAGRQEELKNAAGQSVLLSVLVTAALELAAQCMLTPVLRLLRSPEETFALTRLYLRVIFGGMPLVMCSNLCASFLRAVGDSRTPMIAVILSTVLNIALDALFVLSFRWGVAGAAAATVSAQGLNALICLLAVCRLPVFRLERRHLKPQGAVCRRLFGLGLPVAAGNLVICLGGLVLQRVVNGFGFLFMAGYNTSSRLQGLVEMAGSSLGAGVATFAGQNYGAGKMDRVREGVRKSALVALGISLTVTAVMLVFGRGLLSLFLRDDPSVTEQVLAYAVRFLRVMALGLFTLYLLFVYRSALQGIGDTVIPMLSGVVELLMRVGAVLVLPLFLGERGVYLAEVAAWAGAMVLLVIGYRRRMKGK